MLARPLAVALFLGYMTRPSGALAIQTFPALVPSVSPHPHHTNRVDWGVVLPRGFTKSIRGDCHVSRKGRGSLSQFYGQDVCESAFAVKCTLSQF